MTTGYPLQRVYYVIIITRQRDHNAMLSFRRDRTQRRATWPPVFHRVRPHDNVMIIMTTTVMMIIQGVRNQRGHVFPLCETLRVVRPAYALKTPRIYTRAYAQWSLRVCNTGKRRRVVRPTYRRTCSAKSVGSIVILSPYELVVRERRGAARGRASRPTDRTRVQILHPARYVS